MTGVEKGLETLVNPYNSNLAENIQDTGYFASDQHTMSIALQPFSAFQRQISSGEVENCMSPTVELGRDFEMLIRRCIQERHRHSMDTVTMETTEAGDEEEGGESCDEGTEVITNDENEEDTKISDENKSADSVVESDNSNEVSGGFPEKEENENKESVESTEANTMEPPTEDWASPSEIAEWTSQGNDWLAPLPAPAPCPIQPVVTDWATEPCPPPSAGTPNWGTVTDDWAAEPCPRPPRPSRVTPNWGTAADDWATEPWTPPVPEFKVEDFDEEFPLVLGGGGKTCAPKVRKAKRTKKWSVMCVSYLSFEPVKRNPASALMDFEMYEEWERFEEQCDKDRETMVNSDGDKDNAVEDSVSSEAGVDVTENDSEKQEQEVKEEESVVSEAKNKPDCISKIVVAATTNVPKRLRRKNRKVSFGPRLSTSYLTSTSGNTSFPDGYSYVWSHYDCVFNDHYTDQWERGFLPEGHCDITNTVSSMYDYTDKIHWRRLEYLEQYQGTCALKRLRVKDKWHHQKAHKQVKTKYCETVHNCPHGKKLSIHHRVVKLMRMVFQANSRLPTISVKQIDREKGFHGKHGKSASGATNNSPTTKSTYRYVPPTRAPRRPPQPAYAMTAYNADGDLETDLINLLLTLQDRDITPEDYDLLLRLDERVKAKTVGTGVLERMNTDKVDQAVVDSGASCAVCMEDYDLGQERKHLPCGHIFHTDCITMWLSNSSPNCPLDGQEVA